jgi:hypothetical protein
MMKKLSITIATIWIFLMMLTPSAFAEEVLSYTDDTNDVLDATTGGKISRPNIDISTISCSKEDKIVELKLKLVSSGDIQNKLTIYYEMDLTTDLNSYMAFYGGGEIGVTDQDDNEVDVIEYSGVGTNELKISFNLSSSEEVCINLSAASFEFSAESEEGYYDEYPNQMEIIDVEIDSPTTGTVGKSIKFKGSTTYEGSDLEWSWDFGDNDTSDLREPSHTYTEKGEYEVSLEVYDSTGLVYGFASTTVNISGGSSNGNGSNGSGDSGSGLIVFTVLIIIVVIVVVAVVFFIRRR